MTSERIAGSISRLRALGTGVVGTFALAVALLLRTNQATASDASIPVIDLSVELAAPSTQGVPPLTSPRGEATRSDSAKDV